ncbi:MAG: sigma-54-dependent Fis family transcriptional regulator [Proteobacteria bacterium]|nr:MAG: sigma-54-dependent Fis family transcriptional regulator [Pseudomonadota bacterium]
MIRLEVVQGQDKGMTFETEEPQVLIGRADNASFLLSDSHLSGEHGLIFRDQDHYVYRDLRSTNGSMLLRGQKRVLLDGSDRWETTLRDGDRLLLGDATSPVIVLCKLQLETGEEKEPKLIARREREDLDAVADKVEQSPDMPGLHRAFKAFGNGLELEGVLDAVATAVFELISRATHLSILLADGEEKERFTPILARSREGSEGSVPVMMSRAVLRRVLKERAAVLAADAVEDLGSSESIMAANIRSTIGVPLWRGDVIIGVIEIDNRASSGMFAERDLDLLLVLGQQAALAIDNAQLYSQLQLAQERVEGENSYLKRKSQPISFDHIIGEAASMKEIFRALERVIDTRATVCIFGETGTGKELVASAIHHQGRRREKMFVAQNCAALPENLLESELFGHKKGSFTGADHDKKGLFEIADGGTLFLDEIGEMPMTLQAKLLRVLQEGEVRPVGAARPKQVDVRIICATNRTLDKEVEEGRFRQDLYYRLMVFPITLPPLRERRDDIPLLVQHFLKRYTQEMRKAVGSVSQEALNHLSSYQWPGNIRELENEVQRLVIQVDEGAIVQAEHLSPHIRKIEGMVERIAPKKGTLKEMMESVERWILTEALKDHGNNKTQTAATLGITREGLHKKLSKYGI